MAHIALPEFEEMSSSIQEKARPILEKTGKLGEIFKLLALDKISILRLTGWFNVFYSIKHISPTRSKNR